MHNTTVSKKTSYIVEVFVVLAIVGLDWHCRSCSENIFSPLTACVFLFPKALNAYHIASNEAYGFGSMVIEPGYNVGIKVANYSCTTIRTTSNTTSTPGARTRSHPVTAELPHFRFSATGNPGKPGNSRVAHKLSSNVVRRVERSPPAPRWSQPWESCSLYWGQHSKAPVGKV